MRETLSRARAKIEAFSPETLTVELRENIAPRLARGEPCTLEIADQIVRARHRIKNVLPLRAVMLCAYTAVIGGPGMLWNVEAICTSTFGIL